MKNMVLTAIAQRVEGLEKLESSERTIRKLRTVEALKMLVEKCEELTEEEADIVLAAVGQPRGEKISLKAGDKIMDLLAKYSTRRNVLAKLNEVATANGLVLNFSTGLVEQAK